MAPESAAPEGVSYLFHMENHFAKVGIPIRGEKRAFTRVNHHAETRDEPGCLELTEEDG